MPLDYPERQARIPKNTDKSLASLRLRAVRIYLNMKMSEFAELYDSNGQAEWNRESLTNGNRINIVEGIKLCEASGFGLNWFYRGWKDDIPRSAADGVWQCYVDLVADWLGMDKAQVERELSSHSSGPRLKIKPKDKKTARSKKAASKAKPDHNGEDSDQAAA